MTWQFLWGFFAGIWTAALTRLLFNRIDAAIIADAQDEP
jgi:hypothetical protein